VIRSIRNFDPVGCGAFSINETLHIQSLYYFPEDTLLHAMLAEHFEDIEKLDYGKISRALSVPESAVIEKSKVLHNLNPFPEDLFQGGKQGR
jgi:DNA-directed RNA polymerase specialized sigma subunit, sigma54 homolog